MNLPAKLFLFVLLTSICLFLGLIAHNTRHRALPKDFTALKKDLIELQQGSRVSADSAAFHLFAFVEPIRFGRALQSLHNDAKLQQPPVPGSNSLALIKEVFNAAEFTHYCVMHKQGDDKVLYKDTANAQRYLAEKCEEAFQSLEAEERQSHQR